MWYRKITALTLLLSLFIVCFLPITVSASEDSSYSTVLEDLQNTNDFDFDIFNQAGGLLGGAANYSLDVFHIAEGENGQLFVYVFQPGSDRSDIRARSINMSLQHYEDSAPVYELYNLTYIDSYKTLQKYVVDNFTVSDSSVRYYNIASVYRSNIPDLDNGGGYGKAFPVAKCFVAYNANGTTKYEAFKTEVVNISIEDCASIRYSVPGAALSVDYKDCHYVAFSIENYDVTDIYDATIIYSISHFQEVQPLGKIECTQTEAVNKELYYDRKETVKGWFGNEYVWNQIMSVNDFKNNIAESEGEELVFDEGINSSEFVFMYETTAYSFFTGLDGTTVYSYSQIDDVSILRLHFATPENTYNLGVVSDMVSDEGPKFDIDIGDQFEDAIDRFVAGFNELDEYFDFFYSFLAITVGIVLVCVVIPYLKPLFAFIGNGFSEIWEFITSPFKRKEKGVKKKNEKRK